MRTYYNNTILKLARFIHIMLGEMYQIPGNCRNILEIWWWSEVTGHYKKIPPLYLRKNLPGYGECQEFNPFAPEPPMTARADPRPF